ncbi:MAG: hypothetical protein ACXAD7_24080 [Candidatus Kariarchaeaceae archaeon]|jgi:tetratricopeptide (TPR) repeat protein
MKRIILIKAIITKRKDSVDQHSGPFWIELVKDENTWNVTNSIGWPLIQTNMQEEIKRNIIETLNSFNLKTDINRFSSKTVRIKGFIELITTSRDVLQFRGLWLPLQFESLLLLIKEIFSEWSLYNTDFMTWIYEFHKIRTEPKFLHLFQPRGRFTILLPPTWLLNDTMIDKEILPKLEDSLIDISIMEPKKILDTILPDAMIEAIRNIPYEEELIIFKLYYYILQNSFQSDFTLFSLITEKLMSINEIFGRIVWLKVIGKTNFTEVSIKEVIIKKLIELLNNQSFPMIGIVSTRILAKFYENISDLGRAEKYYIDLINNAKINSWDINYDITLAQIGISRISMKQGNFLKALAHYSLARKLLPGYSRKQVLIEADKEIEHISILSASQIFQGAFYQIHSGNVNRHTLAILLEGLHHSLYLLTRHHIFKRDQISQMLRPLIFPALEILEENKDLTFEMLKTEVDFNHLKQIIIQLFAMPNKNNIMQAKYILNDLEERETGVIERITLFYSDGRHILDMEMRDHEINIVEGSQLDQLFSSAIAAVNMLVVESSKSEAPVDHIKSGWLNILLEQGNWINLTVMSKANNPIIRSQMKKVIVKIESQLDLANWDGSLDIFRKIPILFESFSYFMINVS